MTTITKAAAILLIPSAPLARRGYRLRARLSRVRQPYRVDHVSSYPGRTSPSQFPDLITTTASSKVLEGVVQGSAFGSYIDPPH